MYCFQLPVKSVLINIIDPYNVKDLLKAHKLMMQDETIIKDNQEDYYRAIAKSTQEAKSNEFIIFMLEVIEKATHIFFY